MSVGNLEMTSWESKLANLLTLFQILRRGEHKNGHLVLGAW